MRYDAEIHVYDALDRIVVHVRMFSTDGLSLHEHQLVLEETQTCPGTGEPEPVEWLKDALIYCLEELHNRESPASQAGLPW